MKSIVGRILLFLGFLGGMLVVLDFLISWEIRIINLGLLVLSFESIYFGTKFIEKGRGHEQSSGQPHSQMGVLIVGGVAFLGYTTLMIVSGGFDIPSIFIVVVLGWVTYLVGTDVFEARKRNRDKE